MARIGLLRISSTLRISYTWPHWLDTVCFSVMDQSERLGVVLALEQEFAGPGSRESCDLLLSAFLSALKASRRASVCKPFPIHISSIEGHQALTLQTDQLPAIPTTEAELNSTTDKQLQLMQWLFLHLHLKRGFSLTLITAAQLAAELQAAGHQLQDLCQVARCRCILRIDNHSSTSPHSTVITGRKTAAYHGTDFRNMHSILHNGLLAASGTKLQSTGAVFGSGIYLAEDFNVAYAFCTAREGWSASIIGKHLRCVLLCDVDTDIAVQGGSTTRQAANGLPEKYILVPRPSGVVVRYLLVFSDDVLLGHTHTATMGHPGRAGHGAAAACAYVTAAYIVLMLLLAAWGRLKISRSW